MEATIFPTVINDAPKSTERNNGVEVRAQQGDKSIFGDPAGVFGPGQALETTQAKLGKVLKAKLVGLRNKASMEGDHHGLRKISEQLKALQVGCHSRSRVSGWKCSLKKKMHDLTRAPGGEDGG